MSNETENETRKFLSKRSRKRRLMSQTTTDDLRTGPLFKNIDYDELIATTTKKKEKATVK